jgi:hypothetical protein
VQISYLCRSANGHVSDSFILVAHHDSALSDSSLYSVLLHKLIVFVVAGLISLFMQS